MVVDRNGDTDHVLLEVEQGPGSKSDVAAIQKKLKTEYRLETTHGYEIELHPYQSLPRSDVKMRRFKDLRKK